MIWNVPDGDSWFGQCCCWRGSSVLWAWIHSAVVGNEAFAYPSFWNSQDFPGNLFELGQSHCQLKSFSKHWNKGGKALQVWKWTFSVVLFYNYTIRKRFVALNFVKKHRLSYFYMKTKPASTLSIQYIILPLVSNNLSHLQKSCFLEFWHLKLLKSILKIFSTLQSSC